MPLQGTDLILIERAGVQHKTTAGAVAALGGGGGLATGSGEIDFGAFPGSPSAQLVITGQVGIAAGSIVEAWVVAKATADHSADEHMADPPRLICGEIVPDQGFTIYGLLREPPVMAFSMDRGRVRSENPPLIYGLWSVQWRWQ